MALKAKHAYGSLANVDAALAAGTIDAYDVLFLKDGDVARIGWVDKDGNKVIVEGEKYVVTVEELPTDDGKDNVIYLYNDEAYIWDGAKCVPVSKSADLTALEAEIAKKVDAETVDTKIADAIDNLGVEVVEF